MKKSFTLYLLILIFILCSCAPKLNQININEVRRIYAIQTIEGEEVLNDFDDYEVSEFVSWYNECEDIRSNKEFAGTVTLQYSICIDLENEHISILNSGKDFEIQIHDSTTKKKSSFWAKQKNIKEMLEILHSE